MPTKGQPILLALLLLAFLIPTSALPILSIVTSSLSEGFTVWVSLLTGEPTRNLANWSQALSATLLWLPLIRSLYVALLATVLSVGIGTCLAWLTSITDIRFKRTILYSQILQLILPPVSLAAFWLVLASDLKLSSNISYGPLPMTVILGLHWQSLVFLMVHGALARMNQNLVDAARVHGGSEKAVQFRVVLPLVSPAIFASAGLVMFFSLSSVAPMLLLGTGSQPYYTLSMQIYSLYLSLGTSETVMQLISVLALTLMSVSLVPFAIYYGLMNKGSSYRVVAGRGLLRKELLKLGSARLALSILALAFALTTVVAPLSYLLLNSLSVDSASRLVPSTFSTGALENLFRGNRVIFSAVNTIILGLGVATIGVAISLAISYVILHLKIGLLKRWLYTLSIAPFMIPAASLAIAYLTIITFNTAIFGITFSLQALYGTLFLVILVSVISHLTFGIQVITSALAQIHQSLDEAARVSGASTHTVLRKIIVPLTRNSLLSAWVLMFIFATKEVDIIMFLYPPLSGGQNPSLAQLFQAPPIMYVIFSLLNSPLDNIHFAQGSFLLATLSVAVLGLVILVERTGRVNLGEIYWSRG